MNRSRQIRELEMSLAQLVEILRHDSQCQWLKHFESSLANIQGLISNGFSQAQLNELSSSIMYVYGGMDSFNDYSPAKYDQVSGRYTAISDTERFDEIANQVYEQALSLRVVGEL